MTSLDNELMLFQANKNNELCIFLQHPHPQPHPPPPLNLIISISNNK